MGLFDDFFGKSSKQSAPQTFNTGQATGRNQDAANIYETAENLPANKNALDDVIGNWYKQKPYSFEFGSGTGRREFYLPISPSNLNITTHFATNVISTMYGTVEEHSEQRYFDIQIAGTTGMSPRYYKEIREQAFDSINTKQIGRASFPIKNRIGGEKGLGGFFTRTVSMVENFLNQANDLLGENENDKPSTGVDLRRTGYVAFHNFYKFLLVHKKLAANEPLEEYSSRSKKLRFINYKDNNMYDVAIQTFQLTRDASNPMLYNYNIIMRAYNLRSADSKEITKDVASRAEELGLTGINNSSLFSKISNKSRQAKNAAFSFTGLAKGFGL